MKRMGANYKAVIFDMDGVIVDSMPYHFIAWYEALRPFGVRVSCFDVYAKEGERWDKSLKDFLKKEKIEPTRNILNKIFRSRQKIFRKYFKRYIFKDVEKFLSCLKGKGHVLGLVTGTPIKEVNRILPKRVKNMFSSIVAGDDVKMGKPHPQPYLKAASVLKLKPSQCMVIENAPYGIESAKRAGMFCIALATSLPKEYLMAADVVVDELREVTEIIEKSCDL